MNVKKMCVPAACEFPNQDTPSSAYGRTMALSDRAKHWLLPGLLRHFYLLPEENSSRVTIFFATVVAPRTLSTQTDEHLPSREW
jgi:hypothetical protein